jgi:hypothetical protein
VQSELLSTRPQAALRVYAVWFNMYPGDARTKWSSEFFADPRVTQYWDETRIVGQTYLSHLATILDRRAPQTMPPVDDALWDVFFVYAPDARWEDGPPPPLTWGYPIMVTRDTLASRIDTLTRK